MKNSAYIIINALGITLISIWGPWYLVPVWCFGTAWLFATKPWIAALVSAFVPFLIWWAFIVKIDNGSMQELLGALFSMRPFQTPILASLLIAAPSLFLGVGGALLRTRQEYAID